MFFDLQQHFTALHEAARYGHTVTARMLIEKNSNVNAEAIVSPKNTCRFSLLNAVAFMNAQQSNVMVI